MVINLVLIDGALFTARKAVRENLVKDLIVNPLRAVIRVIHGKLLQPGRRETAETLRGKPQLAVVPQQLEAVAATRLPAAQIDICPPRRDARLRLAAQGHTFRLIVPCQPERNHKVVFVLLNKWGNRKVPGV